jgi:pyrimidine operon attenuation protein/uracil phosphoribosyltransferase
MTTRHDPVTTPEVWKETAELDAIIARMAEDLRALIQARRISAPLMIGIHTGGVWVADRLHEALELTEPLGHLDISFYRDDFTRIGTHPQVRPSYLPVGIDDRHLILVDDVLQSGRTIRAALNVLFDYGRPASVMLATLAERDGRELPIEPNVVGLHARLAPGTQIKLSGPEPLMLLSSAIARPSLTKTGSTTPDATRSR